MYRAYLATPVWKAKRLEALNHYGCKCMRCGEWGNDVHHKTYERVGGAELMEDFEILCRECHEAHHAVDKIARRNPDNPAERSIHRQAIYRQLTAEHVNKIWDKFPNVRHTTLQDAINFGNPDIAEFAGALLGCNHVFGIKRFKPFGPKQRPLYSTKELKAFRKRDKYLKIR